jgi:beta-glucosidase
MKHLLLLALIFTSILYSSCNEPKIKQQSTHPFVDDEIVAKIDSILNLMTLEEKLGQMSQPYVKVIPPNLEERIKKGEVGSLLKGMTSFFTPGERNKYQRIAVEESRLGIPIIFGHDVIHGFKTIFPLSIAQSCSWSPELIKQGAEIAAKEASAYGCDWTFSPMVDIARDPRWGRIAEGYGEDPYLTGVLGAAAVEGFQGTNLASDTSIVACLKHFVGYGAAMGGRDYQFTDISTRSLYEVYLPPFKAGVDAGALTVMSGFNDINGVPATANESTIRNILKNKWEFPGFVVSDWESVKELNPHGIAADSAEAAVLAVVAGTDMEMKTLHYFSLDNSLDNGLISEELIDDAVRRILFVKFKKGLFDNPYVDETRINTDVLTAKNRAAARKTGSESMVLLKNDHTVLPITNKQKTIAIVGPFAEEKEVMGWWKSRGETKDVITAFEGIKANASNFNITNKVTNKTDVIVVCVGEKREQFGENNNRSNLKLPNDQEELITELKKTGKPLIVVIFNGRPLDLSGIVNVADAILVAWHPGTETGNALYDVLFGEFNPSGKLTTSWPNSVGQIPVYYNHRNSGRPQSNRYVDNTSQPLFPFGFGMSYTTFRYEEIKVSNEVVAMDGVVNISAKITNTGKVAGTEIVQLYVRDLVGTTTRPVKELKGFKRIWLEAGQSSTVELSIDVSDLAVFDKDFNAQVEPGKFHVWVGPNSIEGLQSEFEIRQ